VSLLPLITGLINWTELSLFWCSLMYCTVGSYREPLVQRLHVIYALSVQRVNRCVEKGVGLVAVPSLPCRPLCCAHSRCIGNESVTHEAAMRAQPLTSSGRSTLRLLGATPQYILCILTVIFPHWLFNYSFYNFLLMKIIFSRVQNLGNHQGNLLHNYRGRISRKVE
jgi:hypothetical protein